MTFSEGAISTFAHSPSTFAVLHVTKKQDFLLLTEPRFHILYPPPLLRFAPLLFLFFLPPPAKSTIALGKRKTGPAAFSHPTCRFAVLPAVLARVLQTGKFGSSISKALQMPEPSKKKIGQGHPEASLY